MDADSTSSAPKLDVTEERKRALAAQATDGSLAGNAPSFGFNDGGEAIFEADQASYTRAQSVLHEQKKREERDAFAQARQAASAATAPSPLAAPAARPTKAAPPKPKAALPGIVQVAKKRPAEAPAAAPAAAPAEAPAAVPASEADAKRIKPTPAPAAAPAPALAALVGYGSDSDGDGDSSAP